MLARMVGTARALEICLEGRPFTADEALELGLLTKTVKDERELREETMILARRMANRAPQAVRAIKRAIHEGGSYSLEDGMIVEVAGCAQTRLGRANEHSFTASAAQPATQSAMRQYIHSIGEVLGEAVTLKSLQPWLCVLAAARRC